MSRGYNVSGFIKAMVWRVNRRGETDAPPPDRRGAERLFLALISLLLLFVPLSPAHGQDTSGESAASTTEAPLLAISEVLRDADHDTVPDRLDQRVRVRGTVTLPSGLFSDDFLQAFVQGETGGVFLFNRDEQVDLEEGERVEVEGRVTQYRGAIQIDSAQIRKLEGGHPVTPVPLSVKEAANWSRFGQLVRVEGVVGAPALDPVPLLPLRGDEGGEINIFLPEKIALRFPLARFGEGSRIEAVGVISIHKRSFPYDHGFQLVIRDADDVTLLQGPPAAWKRQMPLLVVGLVGAVSVLVLIGLTLRHRRRAHERELGLMNALSAAIATPAMGVDDLLDLGCRLVIDYGLGDAAITHLYDEDGALHLRATAGLPHDSVELFSEERLRQRLGTIITGRDRDTGEVNLRDQSLLLSIRSQGLHLVGCFPLWARQRTQGVMTVFSRTRLIPSGSQTRQLKSASSLIALGIENIEMFRRSEEDRQELKQLAITDDLTGLYNRRFLDEYLRIQIAMARRKHNPIGFLVIDIDHFKRVNDTYGHEAGDLVLMRIGERLRHVTRASDLPVRFGGEEFLVVMPDTGADGACAFAERVRAELSDQPIEDLIPAASLGLTVSIGVSVYPQHGESVSQVLRAADEALYRSKKQGRDRVTLATDGLLTE